MEETEEEEETEGEEEMEETEGGEEEEEAAVMAGIFLSILLIPFSSLYSLLPLFPFVFLILFSLIFFIY